MKDLVFISSNPNKAAYLARWLGRSVPYQKLELDELQSLDLREVIDHKARQAYALVRRPVLVEDVALTIHALGKLPGTLIKWFLEEMGTDDLCRLADMHDDRSATASIAYALFDGQEMHVFEAAAPGRIAPAPRSSGASGWKSTRSWNAVFIPDGARKTYAEMTDDEIRPFSHRAKAIEKLRAYLAGPDAS